MAQTFLYGSLIQSGSIPTTALGGGVVSSSAQLPTGTISSSAQVDYNSIQNKLSGVVSASAQVTPLLPAGTVSSSGQIDYNSITNKLSGVVSASAQVTPLLPTGTVSSSLQINTGSFSGSITTASYVSPSGLPAGTISASNQVVWSSVNYSAGIVSSSGQVQPLLPAGTVSSSNQFNNLTSPFTGSFTGSHVGNFTGSILAPSVVSSSAQVQANLPAGTVSSSAQYPGWVTASSQIDYNSITNKLSGVYSSSTQAVAAIAGQTIAPAIINATGAISGASIQVSGNGTVGGNLTVTGTLTAASQSIQYVTSSQFNVSTNKIIVNTNQSLQFGGLSVIDSGSANNSGSLYWDSINNRWLYENASGGTYNSAILINGPINTGATGTERGLVVGRVPVATGDDHIDTAAASSSIRVDYTSTKRVDIEAGLFVTGALTANGTVTLAGIPSSSAQVTTLLPAGTVSSSAQYPGWMTSSAQVVWSSVNYNSGIVSSSGQVAPLLPANTVSSSAQVTAFLPANTVSSSTQFKTLTDPFTGSFTGSHIGNFTGSILAAGVISSSTQVVAALPVGTVSSSTQLPAGTVSSSTQIVWSSVNYNSGIVSSSAQVAPLLPGGTVSSSAQYPGWMTASSQVVWSSVNYNSGIVSSSTQFNNLTSPFTGSFSGSLLGTFTGSVLANNGVVSSSTQVQANLPAGTVSSSAQYPGWVTSSAQIVWSSVNYNSGILSSSTQFNALTGTSASYALTASYVANAVVGAGVVSSSTQFKTLTDPFTGSFTGSFTGNGAGLTNLPLAVQVDNYAFSGDGTTKIFTLSQSYATNSLFISVDGLGQTNILDYTVSNATLTLVDTPPSGSNILVKSLLNTANATGTFSGSFLGNAKLTGNIGINNSVPSASLHVSGTTMVQGIIEQVNITGSAPPTTLNIDATSGSVFYNSGSSANNWTVNFRGDAATTLNSIMYNGQSMTFAVLVNHGATGYTASAHQVDGVSVTPRWQGGTLPSGSGTSTDIYSYTLIKIASASYNLFASQTKFA